MNLQAYFESYRKGVLNDALHGFVEYAKTQPTLSPQFPTYFNYLQSITDNIKHSIEMGNTDLFLANLRAHQTAVLELFKKMVSERGVFSEGWKSFKYSDNHVKLSNGAIITPRHGMNPPGGIHVYATEMMWLNDSKLAAKLIKFKKENGNKFVKLLDNKMIPFSKSMNHESDYVIEWTAEI